MKKHPLKKWKQPPVLRIVNAKPAKKSTFCLRCGMLKSEIRRDGSTCGAWGRSYEKHLYK